MKSKDQWNGPTTSQRHRPLWPVVVAVAVLGLVLVFELLARVRGAVQDDPSEDEARVARACDLGLGSCVAALPSGGEVELSLSPTPVPLAKPLGVRAKFSGVTPERAELRVRSTTMSMGTTRFRLEGLHDVWVGDGQLPVCISGTMTWLAALRIDGEDLAFFRFETRTP